MMTFQPKQNYDKIENVVLSESVSGQNFEHHIFQFIGVSGPTFENCNFSYSRFVDCYVSGSKFIGCNFTGVRFIDSKFRHTEFSNCVFNYCDFKNTKIELSSISSCLPKWPLERRRFLQGLRKNYESLGEMRAVRAALKAEVEAEKEFLKTASDSDDIYYTAKFPSKFQALFQLFRLKIGWLTWGFGEYPERIIFGSVLERGSRH